MTLDVSTRTDHAATTRSSNVPFSEAAALAAGMTPEALEAAVADITTTRAAELPAWFHCLTYLCRRAIAFAETRQYAVARLMRELRAAAA